AELAKFLIDFVVEQTGYPPEVVELEADLEADLGIDSIKKAQLLGEMREMFPGAMTGSESGAAAGTGNNAKNADTLRTLQDILFALAPEGMIEMPDAAEGDETGRIAVPNPMLDERASVTDPGVESNVSQTAPPNSVSEAAEPARSRPVLPEAVRNQAQQALENFIARTSRSDSAGLLSTEAISESPELYLSQGKVFSAEYGVSVQTIHAFDQWLYAHTDVVDLPVEKQAATRLAAWKLPAALIESQHSFLAESKGLMGLDVIGVPGSGLPFAVKSPGGQTIVWSFDPAEVCWRDYVRFLCSLCECIAESEDLPFAATIENLRGCVERLGLPCVAKVFDPRERALAELMSYRQTVIAKIRGLDSQLAVEEDSVGGKQAPPFNAFNACIALDPASNQIVLEGGSTDAANAAPHSDSTEPNFSAELNSEQLIVDTSHESETEVTTRYELQMAPARSRGAEGRRRQPEWFGRALVIGDNPAATQLVARIRSVGVECLQLSSDHEVNLAEAFAALSEETPIPHLFITTPLDASARFELSNTAWRERRQAGLINLFWLCQKWHQHVLENGLAYEASLVATTSLGGDFGLSGNVQSIEGGGLAGLLKSMSIESWTQGIRPLAIKVLDTQPQQSASDVVACIWQELAYPNYDTEVSYANGVRQVVRAIPRSLAPGDASRVKPGGNWVCTGGARGITAYVGERLAERYGLTLHLLGKSPEPAIDPGWRDREADGLKELKINVMTGARDAGENPVKAWQRVEKALEIDATIHRLRARGITAHYHSCDVSDVNSLERVLGRVREISGPIDAVLHGAGVGKDSRFDRKQRDKVDECIAAKIDGAMALMEATARDPLQFFIGFGSISGRFGANGHTDYSLANEMLCKQIDWFQRQRPEVRAVGFHWHAWGDVGMATKPETKLALEMIEMQFMPAREGLNHLVRELESDSNATEVLITDDRYFRMFFPSETVVASGAEQGSASGVTATALLKNSKQNGQKKTYEAIVDPNRDQFLTEHLLGQRPLLPFVVAAECFHEAARDQFGTDQIQLKEVEALTPLRFFGDQKQTLSVAVETDNSQQRQFKLCCDFHSRNGTLVESQRVHFRAGASPNPSHSVEGSTRLKRPVGTPWQKAVYPESDSEFYVGWSLQKLRRYLLTDGGIIGWISAPAVVELAGNWRDTSGWKVPSAALDSCLFTAGILAWEQVAAGSALPVRMQSLAVGRLPDPGEACEVHVQLLESFTRTDGRLGAMFDFTLYGCNEEPLVDVQGYEVSWMDARVTPGVADADASSAPASAPPEK
ncbi:MAG: SDR family oxidoreductase, partial [Planctomycetota bacterium]